MSRVVVPRGVAKRLSKQVCNFQRVFAGARGRGVSTPETAAIVYQALGELFGFDRKTEVSAEAGARGGPACRLIVQTGDRTGALVEVIAVGAKIDDDKRRRAIGGGESRGLRWVVITNGSDWEVHRSERAAEVAEREIMRPIVAWNLFELSPRSDSDQSQLFHLCREGFQTDALETRYRYVNAVNRHSISAVILSDAGLDLIRRELRRDVHGLDVSETEIRDLLLSLLREDVLPSRPRFSLRPREESGSQEESGPRRLDTQPAAEPEARWTHSKAAMLRPVASA